MKRRALTPEEQDEAQRLSSCWNEFRTTHPDATQSWLAEASGLGTQGAVSQYLRGAIPLNLHALLAMCRVIHADPDHVSPRLMERVHGGARRETNVIDVSQDAMVKTHSRHGQASQKLSGPYPDGDGDHKDPELTFIPKGRLIVTEGLPGIVIGHEVSEPTTTPVLTSWIVEKGYVPSSLVATYVSGEGMEPTLYDGDLVVVNIDDTLPVDGGVYVINYEGEPVIKRLTRDAGQWWLTSDNLDQRKYQRKVCSGDACIIVARIVRRETERL